MGSIVNSLENYKEDYYERLYAEEVLRKKFLENLPFGKTKAEIKKMSADALIALDMDMTYEENDRFKDRQY